MQKKKEWQVYIIKTKSGKLYTGISNDLQRRFAAHQKGKKGAKFFRFSRAQTILFKESHPNRSEASKRECDIKKMSRKQKLVLILLSKSQAE